MFLSWYKQNCEIIPTSASSLLTNIIHTRQQELPDVGFRWPHRLGPRTILQWTHSHLDISSGDTASLFSKECGTAWSFLPSSVGHFQPDGVGIPHETNRAFTEFPLLEGLPLVPLDFHPKPEKNDPKPWNSVLPDHLDPGQKRLLWYSLMPGTNCVFKDRRPQFTMESLQV
jgi:hypothetical protein